MNEGDQRIRLLRALRNQYMLSPELNSFPDEFHCWHLPSAWMAAANVPESLKKRKRNTMPSRRRNKKGKARRKTSATNDMAVNGEAVNERRQVLEPIITPLQSFFSLQVLHQLDNFPFPREDQMCDHGFPLPPVGSYERRFLAAFALELDAVDEYHNLVAACMWANQNLWRMGFEKVGSDADLRSTMKGFLVSFGTDYILRGETSKGICVAGFTQNLENIDNSPPSTISYHQLAQEGKSMMVRDILEGGERAAVIFFHKRLSCSCLQEKYEQLKDTPKVGKCMHCEVQKERKQLMLCIRCKFGQYCSKECQVADWPCHKEDCRKRSCRPATK